MGGDDGIYGSELGSASDDSDDRSLSLTLIFSSSRSLASPMNPPRTDPSATFSPHLEVSNH